MFYHAYNNYLENAYPYDELRPLTCDGQDTWGRYNHSYIWFWYYFSKNFTGLIWLKYLQSKEETSLLFWFGHKQTSQCIYFVPDLASYGFKRLLSLYTSLWSLILKAMTLTASL